MRLDIAVTHHARVTGCAVLLVRVAGCAAATVVGSAGLQGRMAVMLVLVGALMMVWLMVEWAQMMVWLMMV